MNERSFYSGKYSGYTDEELMEVIDTGLFGPDEAKYAIYSTIHSDREDLIHNGKLLHFREIDKNLDLLPGTAQRVLNKVAKRYGLKPLLETEHLVRYKTNRSKGS